MRSIGARGRRRAIEIDFYLRRVESKVVRLENEMWKKTLLLGAASFSPLLASKIQPSGVAATSAVQLLEMGTPLTLLFLAIFRALVVRFRFFRVLRLGTGGIVFDRDAGDKDGACVA